LIPGARRRFALMSVDEFKVVDIVSTDKNRNIVLTVSDYLAWEEPARHLLVLQEKINVYLSFIESGEIYEKYPDAKDRPIRIEVVFKYQPTSKAHLLSKAKSIVEGDGFGFGFERLSVLALKI
jgi:hypothetical protein